MKTRSNRQDGQRLWILPVLLIGSFLVLAWSTEAQTGKSSRGMKERETDWGQFMQLAEGLKWGCRTGPFETNSAKLLDGQIDCLKKAGEQLRSQFQGDWVVIDGHRDPSERKGISLSRANEARDYLIKEVGLEPNSIKVRRFCDYCPIGSKDNPNNRRIEIGIIAPGSNLSDNSTVYKCTAYIPGQCDEKETSNIFIFKN